MERLFPDIPEDLSAVEGEQLTAWRTEIGATLLALANGEQELPEGTKQDEVFAASAAAAADSQRIETFMAEQEEAVAEGRATLLALAAQAGAAVDETDTPPGDEGDGTGTGDGEGDDDTAEVLAAAVEIVDELETEVVEEAEAIAASAAEAAPKRAALPVPARRHQPVISVNERSDERVLVAAAGIPGVPEGELNRMTLAEALQKVQGKTRPMPGAPNITVGIAHTPFPEERRLHEGDHYGNSEKIRAILPQYAGREGGMEIEALTAAGGLCAPLTPFYDLPQFASAYRPVRAALPSYEAARGGVTVPTPGTIGDITTAITVITEAEDAEGGSAATKSCQDLTCEQFTDVAVTAIAHCRTYGNLGARAWPEQVAFQNDLTMAAWARTAESYILGRIKTLSINVTAAKPYNSVFSLIYTLGRAAAATRYRLRMNPDSRFRALAPAWLLDLLLADLAATQFDRFHTKEDIAAILSRSGVTLSWYGDNPSGADVSQGFANEAAGAIDDYPDEAAIAFFAEGEFLHLDGGTLELGIVRDSILNAENNFQVFGESWEEVARVGPAQGALWIRQTVCPDGVFPALGTALSCA